MCNKKELLPSKEENDSSNIGYHTHAHEKLIQDGIACWITLHKEIKIQLGFFNHQDGPSSRLGMQETCTVRMGVIFVQEFFI